MATMTEGSAYEVGKFYRVLCLKTRERLNGGYAPVWHGEWVPVLGPLHRDAGTVNFPWLHWHVDLRFVSARIFEGLGGYRSPFAIPLQKHPTYPLGERFETTEDVSDSFVEGEPQERKLKCKRAMPAFPITLAKWLKKLEKEHCGIVMKNMVCPHRGIPLHGCPTDGEVVTCPGHGLRWNVKTGELVR